MKGTKQQYSLACDKAAVAVSVIRHQVILGTLGRDAAAERERLLVKSLAYGVELPAPEVSYDVNKAFQALPSNLFIHPATKPLVAVVTNDLVRSGLLDSTN